MSRETELMLLRWRAEERGKKRQLPGLAGLLATAKNHDLKYRNFACNITEPLFVFCATVRLSSFSDQPKLDTQLAYGQEG